MRSACPTTLTTRRRSSRAPTLERRAGPTRAIRRRRSWRIGGVASRARTATSGSGTRRRSQSTYSNGSSRQHRSSSTPSAAAARLDREWVGIDISATAIDIILNERLPKLGVTAKTNGIPMDLAAARALHRDSYFDFERWAVTRVRGLVPNEIMIGDGGVDGRGRLLASPRDFDSTLLLAQVRGGASISVNDVRHSAIACLDGSGRRDIHHDGLVDSRSARRGRGIGHDPCRRREFPRVQFWIADYFNSALPTLADPYGKPIQRTDGG